MQVEFEIPEIDFQLASLEIEQNLQIQEIQIQEEQGLQQEFQAIEMFYIEPVQPLGFLEEPEREIDAQQQNTISAGTTTYADLNTKSSGTDTYNGSRTNLTITSAASNASVAASVGTVVGGFSPVHEIDYSNRQIKQQVVLDVMALGRNTMPRLALIEKNHSYSASDTGNVTPSAAFTVGQMGLGIEVNSSLTSTVSNDVTAGSTYLENEEVPSLTNYLITVSSEATNTTGVANSIQTTVTVESDGGVAGNTNKASGTDNGVT